MPNCDFKSSNIEIQDDRSSLWVPCNVTACKEVVTPLIREKVEGGKIEVHGNLSFMDGANELCCQTNPCTSVTDEIVNQNVSNGDSAGKATMEKILIATYVNEQEDNFQVYETVTVVEPVDPIDSMQGRDIATYTNEKNTPVSIQETVTEVEPIDPIDSMQGRDIAIYTNENNDPVSIQETITLIEHDNTTPKQLIFTVEDGGKYKITFESEISDFSYIPP